MGTWHMLRYHTITHSLHFTTHTLEGALALKRDIKVNAIRQPKQLLHLALELSHPLRAR